MYIAGRSRNSGILSLEKKHMVAPQKVNTELPYDPEIQFLDIYCKRIESRVTYILVHSC